MRSKRRGRLTAAGISLLTGAGLVLLAPSVPAPAVPAAPSAAPATKIVSYAGYQIEVPRSWPVHDLAEEPERCVRFDRHAVYLGLPGPAQDCPAHLTGKVDALLIEPLDPVASNRVEPGAAMTPAGSAVPEDLPAAPDHELQVVVDEASILVTATYGPNRDGVERVLASATLTADAQPTEMPEPSSPEPSNSARTTDGDAVRLAAVGGTKWAGQGFDACTAPSVGAMQAWWTNSPFGAANIYIGGASRACAQPNLTAAWVDTIRAQGWVLIPTYVGLQAPCTGFPNRINPSQADGQGTAAADDAVAQAEGLGLGTGSPIYFDMEGYNTGAAGCTDAVMTFLSAWTSRLHERGFVSGVYSSSASGIADLVRNGGSITSPDDIWFANWDGRATIWGDPYFSDSAFADRQRIHQYRGDHNETWGGVTINIDSNVLDADVAGGDGGGAPGRFWVDTFADAAGFDAPGGTQTGTLLAGTNYVFCRVWGPEVREGDSFNHWWLLTDLDVGPAGQWVSAYWLSRWGNDEARDNNGAEIPDCNEPYGAIGERWRALGGAHSVGPSAMAWLIYIQA